MDFHTIPTPKHSSQEQPPTSQKSTRSSNDQCEFQSDPSPDAAEIRRKPWKYIGIKGYSKFIASDDDFFVLRRFDVLNVRVALSLQDEISELEDELEVLDKKYSDKSAEDINNGTFRGDIEERSELMEILKKKLRRYNEFILQQSLLKKLSLAPHRDIKSVKNWHYNHDYAAIAPEEQEYLDHPEDLIRVAPQDKTPLRQVLDSSLRLRTLTFWKRKKRDVPNYDADYVSYYSDKRMDRFSSGLIVFIGAAMLITPIWVLQATRSTQSKLIVITVFMSVFLLVVSSAMATRPFEALAATAGYAAVLMVFIQIQD